MEYSYDGKFKGNVLIVERTGGGKTTFVQNLERNKLFGDISEVFWISKITLSGEREDAIRESFDDQEVHFSYLIENFMQIKAEYVNSERGEEMAITRLIAMDDISGLADKSDNFSNF